MSQGSHFPMATIGDIKAKSRYALVGGPFGSLLGRNDYVTEGVPVIRGANLPASRRFSFDEFVFVSEGKANALSGNLAHPGDIVVTQRGTLGQVGLIPEVSPYPRFVVSQSQMKLTVDRSTADPEYVYYALTAPDSIERIHNRALVAGVPHINLGLFASFEVPLPSVTVQRKISGLLSAYDELIENNTRRIAIVEAMAQAIYREWFVKFRYPGHMGVPLVDSALGPIPDGWAVSTIAEAAAPTKYSVTSGPFGSKLGRKDYVESGVPVIRGTNLAIGGGFRDTDFAYVSEAKAVELRSSIALPGDVVVTQRGTLGQVGLIPTSPRHDRYVLSQSQMKVTVDDAEVCRQYVYAALRSSETTERIQNMAMSAGVPHINLKMLRNFPLVIPERKLQERFDAVASEMLALVENLQSSNGSLQATRDVLLPRLISGEIDVSNLDIDVGDATA